MAPMVESEISTDSSSTKSPPSPKSSKLSVLRRNKKVSNASDPQRFQGVGVAYKGKLIGEQDVSEARGDTMCAEAMKNAKAAVKAANARKTRISLQISVDGIKIVDEKSQAVLHNFPVSRISFVAKDKTDARAFGLIYGDSPQNCKFFAIKTAQAADHAVLAIRDMFQMVFEMKKEHIKQVIQQQTDKEDRKSTVAVADLLDLETELQNIAQGVQQLQQIPTDPFGVAPFADQFTESFNSTVSTIDNSGMNNSTASNPFTVSPFQSRPAQQDLFAVNFGHLPPPPSFPAPPLPSQRAQWAQPANIHHMLQSMHMQPNPFSPVPTAQQQFLAGNPFAQTNVVAASSFEFGSVSSKAPAVDWGFNENIAQQKKSFPAFDSQPKNDMRWNESGKRVTSLDEAFSKLVDMDVIIGPTETKKNPFHHIINPQKAPLNSIVSGSCASAVSATTADPFDIDFFR